MIKGGKDKNVSDFMSITDCSAPKAKQIKEVQAKQIVEVQCEESEPELLALTEDRRLAGLYIEKLTSVYNGDSESIRQVLSSIKSDGIKDLILKATYKYKIGFVKLQLVVHPTKDREIDLSMKWTKLFRKRGMGGIRFMVLNKKTLMLENENEMREVMSFLEASPEVFCEVHIIDMMEMGIFIRTNME